MRRALPRWAAVTAVLIFALAVFGGFLALAIPIVVTEATHLASEVPGYLHSLKNHHTFLGKLNARYHVVGAIQRFINKGGSSAIAGGVLGVGKIVLDLVGAVAVVVILVRLPPGGPTPRQTRHIPTGTQEPPGPDGAAHR